MRVLIIGVGDAFTSRHFGSSCLIEAPGGRVLVDCPDLIHRALRDAGERSGWTIDASSIDDIILTHLHGDHCNGLESFGFHRRLAARRDGAAHRRPRLHASPPVIDRLWERLAPAMDGPFGDDTSSSLADYFDVRALQPGQTSVIAGLAVQCRFTKHAVPTIGLLLSDGASTFGWSGDTAFDPEHVRWLTDADLIVHESNLGAVHTPIESLNELDDGLRARMRLIHLPDDFDAACTDIGVLREGEVLDVRART